MPGSSTEINYAGAKRLWNTYRDFFPASFPSISALARIGDEEHEQISQLAITGPRTDEDRERDSLALLFNWSHRLRTAWDEPNLSHKEWFIFEMRQNWHRGMNPGAAGPPDKTPFEMAALHLQRVASRVRHCANPDCEEPYFIATKRSSKYCSEACSKPAQQAFKRDWWAEHGSEWRKNRKESSQKKGKKHAKRQR